MTDRKRFEDLWIAKFPLQMIQVQGGIYYGDTAKYYEFYQAACDEKHKVIAEAIRKIDALPHYGFTGTDLLHKYEVMEILKGE